MAAAKGAADWEGGAAMFSDEEMSEISGLKQCRDYIEVTCGCTSRRYGDAVGRLKVFPSGELEITCECTPGCDEGEFQLQIRPLLSVVPFFFSARLLPRPSVPRVHATRAARSTRRPRDQISLRARRCVDFFRCHGPQPRNPASQPKMVAMSLRVNPREAPLPLVSTEGSCR